MPVDVLKLTPEQLRILIKNADRLGDRDLSTRAFKQLCAVQPAAAVDDGLPTDDAVRIAFWQALFAAEELRTVANGKTTRLSRTRDKAKRDGIIATMQAMALKAQPSEGFRILLKGGHPEFTYEHIICEHADRFDAATVRAARLRLSEFNISL